MKLLVFLCGLASVQATSSHLRQMSLTANLLESASATGATGATGMADMALPSDGVLKDLNSKPIGPAEVKDAPIPEISLATGPGATGVPLTGQIGLVGYTLETFDKPAKDAFRKTLADTAGIDITMALLSGVQDGNSLPALGAGLTAGQPGLYAGAATAAVHTETAAASHLVGAAVANNVNAAPRRRRMLGVSPPLNPPLNPPQDAKPHRFNGLLLDYTAIVAPESVESALSKIVHSLGSSKFINALKKNGATKATSLGSLTPPAPPAGYQIKSKFAAGNGHWAYIHNMDASEPPGLKAFEASKKMAAHEMHRSRKAAEELQKESQRASPKAPSATGGSGTASSANN